MDETDRIIDRAFPPAGRIRLTVDTPGVERLPDDARRFLTDVGLPAGRVAYGFEFERARDGLPLLKQVAPRAVPAYDGPLGEMSVFGEVRELESVVGVDVAGGVWFMSLIGSTPCFVNASVKQFVAFLAVLAVRQAAGEGQPVPGIDTGQHVNQWTEAQMRTLDPEAFGDADTFWSLFVEEMGYGLFG